MSKYIKTDNICNYDEGYTKLDAKDIGWCANCKIKECNNNKVLKKYEGSMNFLVYVIYSIDLIVLSAQFQLENDAKWYIKNKKKQENKKYLLLNNDTGEETEF